ncbi:hypothetical protein L1D24_09305 [Vibrio brasiliensis]|uniref:hypothetical protein n=1 Tax=Vibrio brasiliensis TaxID=170652 RepID=UPI001EFE606E|nr:hypothetical protein [Vibrio brasiliensis]MCG9648770.1 hypothetical protein [Vibrio brasiliensis]
MEKKKTFGNVLAVLLFSASLQTQASDSLTMAYDALEAKKDLCFEVAKTGHQDFPNSDWLKSLEENKRTEVLIYLAQRSFNACLSNEIGAFKKQLAIQTQEVQEFVNKYVSLEPYIIKAPQVAEAAKLQELESKVIKPFHVSKVPFNQP